MRIRRVAAAGAMISLAIVSLFQDFKYDTAEAYAQYILNGGWIDRRKTIPLAILGLVIAIYVLWSEVQREKNADD